METQARMPGCQSTNHTACYGELWQCKNCGKTVCYAEGTDNDPDLCDDCWVQAHPERSSACPTMQWLIERLAFKYQFNVSAAGGCLLLALPESAERLLIAGLSGERVGISHCLADGEGQLVLDLDMVFLIVEDEFQPVELLHTDAVWEAYVQGMATTGGVQIFDEVGEIRLPRFAEYWASTLEQQRWLSSSQRLYV